MRDVCAKIDRGRSKIELWVKLVDAADSIIADSLACVSCGCNPCSGKHCDAVAAEIKLISEKIPLAGVIEMTAAKWMVLKKQRGDLIQRFIREFYTGETKDG